MLKINIISIGDLKESYWKGACTEYSKRLSAFCRFSMMELSEYKLPKNPSRAQINQALDKEGKQIIKKIGKSYSMALCIEGLHLTSEDFSKYIDGLSVNGVSEISFIIGSSYGLSDEVKNFVNAKISLSDMTYAHQLARIMLCEQLYRAYSILTSGKYHK